MNDIEFVTEPLGGSKLAAGLLDGLAPAHWVEQAPAGEAGWIRRAEQIHRKRPRAADALLDALGGEGNVPERVRRALREGFVITTGQQPGLFGGPFYTWHKAMTALALADALEPVLDVPVAPLFWGATDDTDWREASTTVVALPGGSERLWLPGPPTEAVPLGFVAPGDVSGLLERLAAASGSALHAEYLEFARSAYRPDATLGGAYVSLLRSVLGPFGIGVLDTSHSAVRAAVDAPSRIALQRSADLARALAERDDEIRAAGYAAQVATVNGLSLVFHWRDRSKQRVKLADAAALVKAAPSDSLSPNVLLRPVVERAILPTLAYVAGPAEIAYFAQSTAVADALEMDRPMALPRWAGTIIEPHIRRILQRHGLSYDQLLAQHGAERMLAEESLPAEARQAFDAWRAAMHERAAAMRDVAARTGALPTDVVEGAERSLDHRLGRLERRLLAAAKRRDAAMMRDLATARGALRPEGKRQERVLNALPLLARHGDVVLEGIRRAAGQHVRAGQPASRTAAGR